MKLSLWVLLSGIVLAVNSVTAGKLTYPIVDTGQVSCFDNRSEIQGPKKNAEFYGQDAQYLANPPSYRSNGDGTVTDLVTGLMWQQSPGKKVVYSQAIYGASRCRTGGYNDWRLPTIKELYSLIQFNGLDPEPQSASSGSLKPFIDNKYFDFSYGDPRDGDRIIDSQFCSATTCVNRTMNGNKTVFGVNFADGRIKGYPYESIGRRGAKKFYVLYVRGNKDYGKNKFRNNGDGTITDLATGLTWMQYDSDKGMNWEDALKFAENLKYAGKSDWRLPSAKELQSIVDYTKSPATTGTPAISSVFKTSTIKAESGKKDFPFYWTGTTHQRQNYGGSAVYIAFGTGYGWMSFRHSNNKTLLDVHGAGCQRSDPKSGNPSRYKNTGHGPQGDVVRIYNYVRCVRGGNVKKVSGTSGSTRVAGTFLRRLDKNGDNKISASEFDGPSRHFKYMDQNGDGYLSGAEIPSRPPERMGN